MKLTNQLQLYLFAAFLVGISALIIISIVYLGQYFKIFGLWIFSVLLFVLMRLPDSWKIGLELFFFLTFAYSYVFGLLFTLPLIYVSLLFVLKIRPDEGNGLFVHAIVLTGVALFAKYFSSLYGVSITPNQLVFSAMLTIGIWLVIDTIIAVRTAPVPLPKLMINHTLDFMVNYFFITLFGFKVLSYLLLQYP